MTAPQSGHQSISRPDLPRLGNLHSPRDAAHREVALGWTQGGWNLVGGTLVSSLDLDPGFLLLPDCSGPWFFHQSNWNVCASL